eukprot:CAMPEP_0169474548 /NCGR_PEP_ID=MMETSP1042-20121227/26316_1 /TAXON_ID=464988 /ORGANISM="Hemiselmis andersenii, Strain CCMP1180" /LENGTH=85 /DNA_ID=CAMNT_0009588587 /DNA_START=30 /DNA_END=285 /DNA_ORIENTATION=+
MGGPHMRKGASPPTLGCTLGALLRRMTQSGDGPQHGHEHGPAHEGHHHRHDAGRREEGRRSGGAVGRNLDKHSVWVQGGVRGGGG